MSVRFIVGRAGSGKTWHCLEAVRARLREDAAGGNKLLLLVPEQASFQMERALIETPDIAGYTRCEVVSFQRLAFRVFSERGAGGRRGDQTIGSLGRLMAIRRLIRRERPRLRLLDRVADKPGLIRQVAGTIDELMREDVDPAALAELIEKTSANDPLASARLADLTRLYQSYLDYLIDDRLDPAQYLALAAQNLPRCSWIEGAEVWVDGFAGFTQQEYNVLVELGRHVRSMEITLLVDPSAAAIDASEAPALSYSLFARTERTLIRLKKAFRAAHIEPAEPLRLGVAGTPRFARAELAQLERHLFRSNPPTDSPGPRAAVIEVLEAPDRRWEVAAAIAEIQRLTHPSHATGLNGRMRYRDIAVIVRDLATYHDLLSSAMRAHGIPCFIDRRQPTTHHPLIELVRAVMAVAADNYRMESVRLTLKTGLLPFSSDECDLLENYLIAHGLAGRSVWQEYWHFTRIFRYERNEELSDQQKAILARVNALRNRWLEALAPWLNTSPESGRAWAESLYRCLDHLKAEKQLQEWARIAELDGRSEEADQHRQVWTDFVELLDEFVHALGAEPMGIDEFRETIEAGLGEFSLGLAPATLDQVLVGAIERSRHPNVRATLILGFDEQHFPMRRSENPLLADSDRERLESVGVEVGASRRRALLDERMLAYIAMTRASERVWISHPRSDGQGRTLQPSPYLQDVQAALPGLAVTRAADPLEDRAPRWITSVDELGARLAREMRYRPDVAMDAHPERRAVWNDLYDTACGREDWRETLRRSLAGLSQANTAMLEPGLIEEAVGKQPFAASVSRLERFAACPFSHYVDYLLKLRPRVEADLEEMDLGTVYHSILEKFIATLAETGARLGDLEDDQIAERIEGIAGALLPNITKELMLVQPRNAYLFDRGRGHLSRVTRWQRDAARAGAFRPFRTEQRFGMDAQVPALTLITRKGRTLLLRGIIDRVDVAEMGDELLAMVIDYKRTTVRRLNLGEVYHGLTLQLVGYLLALKQMGHSLAGRPIRPVAAFYLPLLEPYQSVRHPSEEKKVRYQWRGVADASKVAVIDQTVAAGSGPSQFLSARLTNDGSPYANCDLAREADLGTLMDHVARRMGELADDLLDGKIGIEPYRLRRHMPCAYCQFKPICRYETGIQAPRSLDSLKKQDVFERMVRDSAVDKPHSDSAQSLEPESRENMNKR